MVYYEVFSHPIYKRYKTTVVSKASILQVITIVLTLLSPFLIAYFTGGFWIKEKMFTEKPEISFQYRYIAILESEANTYVSSSFSNVNEIYVDEYRPSIRSVQEIDTDDDGINDQLKFNMFVSGINDNIKSVKLLLLFNTTLSMYTKMKFESVGYLESVNGIAASGIDSSGELELFQKVKFQEKTTFDEYNYLALNQTNVDLESLKLNNILKEYNQRKYGTRFVQDYTLWTNTVSEGFDINIFIRYVPFKISYIPAFWEQFKWGWIQYISILIPFLFVFNVIKIFIFENHLVPTIAVNPSYKVKDS